MSTDLEPLGPPQVVDAYTLECYNAAVREITGVVSPEIVHGGFGAYAQTFINRMWPIYFMREQQEAILAEYGARLLRVPK